VHDKLGPCSDVALRVQWAPRIEACARPPLGLCELKRSDGIDHGNKYSQAVSRLVPRIGYVGSLTLQIKRVLSKYRFLIARLPGWFDTII
jgi:hypothetical protein